MELVKHENCQQYVKRRLSEGWRIVCRYGHTVVLSPPDGSFLRPVDLRNDVETLRPNAAGDETALPDQSGAGEHWDKVDEAVADEFTTWAGVEHDLGTYRDLYKLPASSGSGTINKITVYFRVYHYTGQEVDTAQAAIKSDDTVTEGAKKIGAAGAWTTHSQEWATNPADSEAWEWADIDALQIGVTLYLSNASWYIACTQLYVEVDYTPPGWTGKISGVTNPAKVMGVDVANIAKVKGVA